MAEFPQSSESLPERLMARRSFAERLFPGPTRPLDRETAERLQKLLLQPERQGRPGPWHSATGSPAAAPETQPRVTARPAADEGDEDAASVADLGSKLDTQTEILRAILASSVDAQIDARSTAQNARTFAWAGTAIALLTLIGTVILAVRGG